MSTNLGFNSVMRWHKSRQRWVATCEVCFDLHVKPAYSVEYYEDEDAREAMQEHMKAVHGKDAVVHPMSAKE